MPDAELCRWRQTAKSLRYALGLQFTWNIGKQCDELKIPIERQSTINLRVDADLRPTCSAAVGRAVVIEGNRAVVTIEDEKHKCTCTEELLGLYLDFRFFVAYAFRVSDDPRQKNALLIAASLIAAVRTAREEEIKASLRVICKVDDSVRLARMVLRRIEREE
jgi:hypothetical protein